ncbi:uncharacterized protein LOC143209655 isoform X3 [Lasioglossum baleicum]|uniref:uncharacterized protein LOC143209655 isoform X3 n=1 Tax=Lasioglossum baleicum TaxID=434251 RepID=UPI003FCCE43C
MSSQDTIDNVQASSPSISSRTKNWVQFEDETPIKDNGDAEEKTKTNTPAVIKPESVTVNVEKIGKAIEKTDNPQAKSNEYRGAVISTESVQINLDRSGLSRSVTSESPELNVPSDIRVSDPKSASLKTIDLRDVSNGRSNASNVISTPIGNIRQGFANGDTIVTLLPVNTRWPWITPAKFRPELVPEELMAQGLTKKLQEVIEREEREGRVIGEDGNSEMRRKRELQQRMDIDDSDIVIQGSTTTRISRKQERAELLLLRYASRWAHHFVRRRLDLVIDSQERNRDVTGLSVSPRHCVSARCPCQFIEDHLKYKPRGKKPGYCGLALYSKEKPIEVKYGLDDKEFDSEGRLITAEYPDFFFINVYVPNAGQKLVTLPKRLKWNEVFKTYIEKLDEKKPVIICGDMNVAHLEIDLTNPKTNTKNAGFTKEERDGMTEFLDSGFVDTFRALYPDKTGAYTFWSYFANARSKNIGWRLDYFLLSQRIKDKVCDNVIRDKVYGSDHCPIVLYVNI